MSSPFKSDAEHRAKEAENYPQLFGAINLTNIRQNIEEVLKLIGRDGIFREYTLHDINHINLVLSLVDKLIPDPTKKLMRTGDWLMIVLSCYFHDLGMLVTKDEFDSRENCIEFAEFKKTVFADTKGVDYDDALRNLNQIDREEFLYQEFVRDNHARRIHDWITGIESTRYGDASAAVDAINGLLAGMNDVVRDDLAKICLSHHEDDLFDLGKYRINRVYGDDDAGQANLHYAAIILRTADVLQIQRGRVPSVLYKLIDPSNPKSQEEWAKQSGVRAVKPVLVATNGETGKIEVHASFEEETAYFGLIAYLQQYASKEIKRCYEWSELAMRQGSSFHFPWNEIDHSQVEPRGFEGRTYRFELDQGRILKLLTGHTLYNDSRVAVREVLQNAIDAVRFQSFLHESEPMGSVAVVWDSSQRRLVVRDSGTGMTQEMIEKFLLNVGASYYQSDLVRKKHSGFSPISRFGIGILSYFMIADGVEIVTNHPDDKYARRLTLPSVVNDYLVKKIDKGSPELNEIGAHGTEVRLQVRRSAEIGNVEDLVRHYVVIPGCSVTCKTDDDEAVPIGFASTGEALSYYFTKSSEGKLPKEWCEKTFRTDGVDLSYIVRRSSFADVWDFETRSVYHDQVKSELDLEPGVCVEGIRVRSGAAGYDGRRGVPWVLANFMGSDTPRTNVARSDVEQSPELARGMHTIYVGILGHAENEMNRMRANGVGLSEAAWEGEFLIHSGLEKGKLSHHTEFKRAVSSLGLCVIEDGVNSRCESVMQLQDRAHVWTVDGRVIDSIENISGALGIDMPAGRLVQSLGVVVDPPLPMPRLVGRSWRGLERREIQSVRVIKDERSHRLDVDWTTEAIRGWICLDEKLVKRIQDQRGYRQTGERDFRIATTAEVGIGCDDYDILCWRNRILLFLLSSGLLALYRALPDERQFGEWLGRLLNEGGIEESQMPLLRSQLLAAGVENPDEIASALSFGFDRRFGASSTSGRAGRFFSIW